MNQHEVPSFDDSKAQQLHGLYIALDRYAEMPPEQHGSPEDARRLHLVRTMMEVLDIPLPIRQL